eukprot:EG_transcript_22932
MLNRDTAVAGAAGPPEPVRGGGGQLVDIAAVRAKLDAALGEHRAAYYDALRRFLVRQLTRSEWEEALRAALGPADLPLHNQLVASVLHNARCQAVDFAEGHPMDPPVLPDYTNSALAPLVPQHTLHPPAAPLPVAFPARVGVRVPNGQSLKRTTKERKGSLLAKEITKKHQEKARALTGLALKCSPFGLPPRGIHRIAAIKPILKRPKPDSDGAAPGADPPLLKRTKLRLGGLSAFRCPPPPPPA